MKGILPIIKIAVILSALSELFAVGNLIYKITLRSELLFPVLLVVITTVVLALSIAMLRMLTAALRSPDDEQEDSDPNHVNDK